MKTSLLFLFLSAGSLLSGGDSVQPVTAPFAGAPAEITQYYHDVNFAACFSTPEERKLVSHMIETSAKDELSARLQTLAGAVQRIRAASAFIDPQMVHEGYGFKSLDEEITEIASMQRTGNRIQVEVSTRTLSPKTRSWLVAQFDTPVQKSAPADSTDVMAEVLKQTARKEIHSWNQVHGRWVRDDAAVVLLKLAK
jgi:hypothetical protein